MFAANYEFHPLYRTVVNGKRKWDGKMRLYSTATRKIYTGLLRYILAFSQERNLKVQINNGLDVLANFSIEEANRFFKHLDPHSGGKPISAYEHQSMGLAKAVRYKRGLFISPTSSGKSLMIYGMTRYFLQRLGGGCKRGLLIVPTTALVEQMYKDFQDYSTTPDHSTWQVEVNCQRLYEAYSEKEVLPHTKLLISTWQSIFDKPVEFFRQFDFVIGDEAHGFKADSLKTIMTALVNARYRIGTTGTLDGYKVHRMVIEGHFGPYSKLATTKELQDKGLVAKLKTKALILKHTEADTKALQAQMSAITGPKATLGSKKFKCEVDFLVRHARRNNFIKNLVLSLKGNRLILVNYIEHGQILYDLLAGHPEVHLVNGGTSTQQREWVRKFCEKNNDSIIIATYGVFSTGVNIKNLPHLIFGSPSKSKIRVLQSIGRILRLHKDKLFAHLYDISDDLQSDDWINYSLRHYVQRLEYYKEEDWKVSSYIIDL
jgi:superfamily II DNA or RNA helicase